MKKLFIIANWKSNKTSLEAKVWLKAISNFTHSTNSGQEFQISNTTNKEVIVCPSFTLLSDLKSLIIDHQLPIKLGAQDISPFDEGAYTGEVNGKQIKELADHVLVGHSERQKYFFETFKLLEKKVLMTAKYNLTPIFLVQDQNTKVPQGVDIVCYEPPSSISPGPADTPENAEAVALEIKKMANISSVLYGGNVTSQNVKGFCAMPNIDGVLVGRASLDADEFAKIIQNA